ncbi:AtpZ/AtpI family protein [Aureivirga sp. CE67]|uniref:AtpZ/AtpI family protein n=1 Tax=Aureivirga sp. CE67 TaxID=1788983 RepID=UPI0018CB866F|nr:AtpZ/AtpI family protein [Aureivirga sp. CE67]
MQQKKKQLNNYIRFSAMGLQMGVTIAAGAIFGQWLDKKYPNSYQIYTVIFSLLAVFASIYNIVRQVLKISKKKDEEEK